MKVLKIFLTLLFISSSLSSVFSQNNLLNSIDTLSKASVKLQTKEKKNKILPVVLPVTEPAIGVGLVGGLVYFKNKKDPKEKTDMIGGAAGITSNGTWFGAGGYSGYWKNDKIRYLGIVGYGDLTMNYYGLGSENPLTFQQNVFFFTQQMLFRIGRSGFFLGGKYILSKIKVPNDFEDSRTINPEDLEFWNSGISFISEFDNLNNSLSPSKGFKVHLSYDQYLELIGSNRDWGILKFYSHIYFPIGVKWTSAFRIESNVSAGRPPFYTYPYVHLRGIPALRYQGRFTILGEIQQTYNFLPRWGAVGFTGIGTAFKSVEDTDNNEIVWNAGAGVRYLLMKDLGLKIGADAARGPEDWAFYIVIGSAW